MDYFGPRESAHGRAGSGPADGCQWSSWFEGLEVSRRPDGSTILRGSLYDQAALQGLLLKVFNLGLSLVAVRAEEAGADELGNGSCDRRRR